MDIVTYADTSTFLVAIGRIEHRKSRWVEEKQSKTIALKFRDMASGVTKHHRVHYRNREAIEPLKRKGVPSRLRCKLKDLIDIPTAFSTEPAQFQIIARAFCLCGATLQV